MANVREIVRGQFFFFIAFMYILIMSYMAEPLIDVGEGLFSTFGIVNTDIQAISWLIIIVFYIFLGIIIPGNMIYQGISEPKDPKISPFMYSIMGISMFFIGLLLTIKGWYIIQAIADTLTGNDLLIAIYWTGLIISWILCNIIAPVIIVLQAQQEA